MHHNYNTWKVLVTFALYLKRIIPVIIWTSSYNLYITYDIEYTQSGTHHVPTQHKLFQSNPYNTKYHNLANLNW